MSKKVMIDLRFLKNLNYGFGQLSLNYGNYIQNNPDKIADLDITLLVRPEYKGKFGNHVKYLTTNSLYKVFPFLMPRYDVWHSITQTARYFSIDESCSKVMTIHDLNFLYGNSPKKSKKRLLRLQKNVDMCSLITVISNFTEQEVLNNLTIKVPLIVNHVGLPDITKDADNKPQFIKNDDRKFFFAIGQVAEKKNFHVLVDMMELMPEYDLYICGQISSNVGYSTMISENIEKKQLKNVFLTGTISAEEKVWMYKHCYAFVFPSKLEGFGIPVVDAMSFGKPVFSSQMTSLKEIGDKYAYFWDNFEPHYMKHVIENNINAFYENKQLIEDEKKYAKSFSIEKHFENYLSIYRGLKPKKKSLLKTLKNYYTFLRY